ncbi:MAG: T9SS type A sorting domain-containing protein [candidate division KSB1 bacterium]|nr:T9SS type A sorting domain-containing protein [candidate division KSB1 bacterium]MDZ7405730.1 T9SS type A sorting domain-containing protein [candidate division KSB1 bacterium]
MAGGPLTVFSNRAVVYRQTAFPLTWRLDPGQLGSYSNADAARLVQDAFNAWEQIATAIPSFVRGENFPDDVTASNYTTYWGKFNDGVNPVLLDSDGQMMDAIRGAGAKNNTLGLAVSAYFTTGPNAGFYAESEILINGFLSNKATLQQYFGVIKHELGHLLGLDHAQINKHEGVDGLPANDALVPLMFPISTTNTEFTVDDIVSVSRLYPAPDFFTNRGTLRGMIQRRNGTFVRGANVIAISAVNPTERYSTVTDYFGNAPGFFELQGLPPGDYFILAEPIVENFTGGSSVGPYAKSRADLSFLQPVPFEYYNGAHESHDHLADRPDEAIAVTVAPNGVTENINFLANDPPNQILDQYFDAKAALFLPIGTTQNYAAAATRFTPSVNGQLLWIRLFINGGENAIQGTGDLRFSVLKPHLANRHLPGEAITQIDVPLQALTRGALIPYELWLGDRNLAVTAGQDFFVSVEVIDNGAVQLLFDDGVTRPVFRTSVKLPNGSWTPGDQAFGKPHNLKMAVAIGGQPPQAALLQFALEQNFPNPLRANATSPRAQTAIRFSLPHNTPAELSLFDLLGRRVRVLAKANFPAGYNVLFWDGRDTNGAELPSGIYFYRLRAGNFEEMRKLMLIR